MQEFKSFVKDVLVATDVASKGLGKCVVPKNIREITFHNKKNLIKKLFFTQIFLKSNMLSTMICRMILKITYIGLDVRVVEMPKVLHFFREIDLYFLKNLVKFKKNKNSLHF